MTNNLLSSLNFASLEQFRDSLDKQEARLADALLLATIPAISNTVQAPLHLHGSGHFRLSQALQVMTTRIRNLHEGMTARNEWQSAVTIIDQAFWDYVEVLRDSSQELFQQMDAVDLSGWSEGFHQIVTSFKELLAHRIEDLIWVYKRVEDLLYAYRSICKKQKNLWMIFGKFTRRFSKVLDKTILEQLLKTDEVLSAHYKHFNISYETMKVLIPEIQEKETKFAKLPVFIKLDREPRDLIVHLYRLVALNEKNMKLKTLNQDLLVTTINNLAKPGQTLAIFRDYIAEIRKRFFNECLNWQNDRDSAIKVPLQALLHEVDFVESMIGSYREILLRAEPDVYAKTRFRFTEWIVGKEPRKTRDLLQLLYQIDTLKRLFSALDVAIDQKTSLKDVGVKKMILRKQIDEVLHEMGQPLSSRNLIQVKLERLIELLDVADELGGSLGDVRPLVSSVLLKAMHLDAKYQALNDYPRFHELFAVHQGMNPPLEDFEHQKRYKLFQSTIRRIEHWLYKGDLPLHHLELENEETAIKEILQSFLGTLQRTHEYSPDHYQMLLEYRYQFSQFFHTLRKFETEGKTIRSQFSFVDQYFDAIAQILFINEKI